MEHNLCLVRNETFTSIVIEEIGETGIEDIVFEEDKYILQCIRRHLMVNDTVNKEQLREFESRIPNLELCYITKCPPDTEEGD